jgi:hypothetical protein
MNTPKAYLTVILTVVMMITSVAFAQMPKKPELPKILPRDLEIELALSAAPPYLREEAAVYVLERGGYVKAKEGMNDHTCIVRRMGVLPMPFFGAISPECHNREGLRSHLAVYFDEAKWLEKGLSFAEVTAKINEGWTNGRYQAPSRAGVSYMVSPVIRVPAPPDGRLISVPPHVMFYAPDVSPKELLSESPEAIMGPYPFTIQPGPMRFIIMMIGEKERTAIVEAEKALITKMQPYLGQ